MMKKQQQDDILKRYYRGETTLEEERWLKNAFRNQEFQEEPILTLQEKTEAVPEALLKKIQTHIHQKAVYSYRRRNLFLAGMAATFVLLISLRGVISSAVSPRVQLSDHLKKERFEDALRIIGQALEEKQAPAQKVLYEDCKFIICVE